jgi:hypothetical protein
MLMGLIDQGVQICLTQVTQVYGGQQVNGGWQVQYMIVQVKMDV